MTSLINLIESGVVNHTNALKLLAEVGKMNGEVLSDPVSAHLSSVGRGIHIHAKNIEDVVVDMATEGLD